MSNATTANRYIVVMIRNMYQSDLMGMGAPVTESEHNSVEDARDHIAGLESESYCTSNGEAGAPEYIIIEDIQTAVGDRWSLSDGNDMGAYDWTDADCECGECQDCIAMMIEQDCAAVRERGL